MSSVHIKQTLDAHVSKIQDVVDIVSTVIASLPLEDDTYVHDQGLINDLFELAKERNATETDPCYARVYSDTDKKGHGEFDESLVVVNPKRLDDLTLPASLLHAPLDKHYAFNFAHGREIETGKPVWRFGIGQSLSCAPNGNCEFGIKHYQLCEYPRQMFLMYSGVLHVMLGGKSVKLVVSPMSGRWESIVDDFIDFARDHHMNDVFDSTDYAGSQFARINALYKEFGRQSAQLYMNMYMTRVVQLHIARMWGMEDSVDSCWQWIVNNNFLNILEKQLKLDTCGKDIYEVYDPST